MKIKDVTLVNFGQYGNISVSFDDNVTYLVGPNGSAKTTMGLTGIWATIEGIAQKGQNVLTGERFRFIGDKAATSTSTITIYDEKIGEIKAERKFTKTGSSLSFEGPAGVTLSQEWLSSLFNILLIAPKRFISLTGREQALALGIDVASFEKELAELKTDYTLINRELTNMGKIDVVEKAVTVDIADLIAEKKLATQHNTEEQKKEDAITTADTTITSTEKSISDAEVTIKNLQAQIEIYKKSLVEWQEYRKKLENPHYKDIESIDAKMETASTTNVAAANYDAYLVKVKNKEVKTKELSDNKEKQADVVARQLAYIKGKQLPFPDLTIGDDGGLLLQGRPLKEPYFSTGELTQIIPILMSSTNPELKYVFIQDFNLLDEVRQQQVEESLTSKGFQLVIEYVGTKEVPGKNCILMEEINKQ